MILKSFDWGWMETSEIGRYHKEQIIDETFTLKLYERFFEVSEGDIVLDIGSSVGSFTYSVLHKKPKHVYSIEPSELEFPTLVRNTVGHPVTPILKGISNTNTHIESDQLYGGESHMEGITFKKLITLYDLEKIDFLKTDCEGGEYHIFNEENFDYITNNVKKIVGEWHLLTPELKDKFRNFRDNYLTKFPNYEIFSVDGINIKWDLFNEHFIDYYTEVIIYIDNR
jgi:FkbM family methyltransferase